MRPHEEIVKEAIAQYKAGEFHEAARIYDRLLSNIDEPDFNLLHGYGTTLAALGQNGLAIHFLRAAIDMCPQFASPWSNLGAALRAAGRDRAALNCLMKSLDIDPRDPETLSNIAGWFVNKGDPESAIKYGALALELAPEHPEGNVHYALGLMEAGRFADAWPHYEYRWNQREHIKDRRPYKAPKWKGEHVNTLAIHGEQGLGDEILFMSCFRAAALRADKVIVECATRLVNVFERSFGVKCYGTHAELIAAEGEPDAYVAMGSLPAIVGLPDGRPYLSHPHWPAKALKATVGIAWRGGVPQTNKRERSVKLSQLAPILSLPGFNFVSVQYGEENIDGEAASQGLPQLLKGRSIDHSVDAISQCDLVISVCQTAVHLAGAMGVPCWVLTPKQCAWRYAGTTDRMLPWYESVKLYRQGNDEKWQPVIERIAEDLQSWT